MDIFRKAGAHLDRLLTGEDERHSHTHLDQECTHIHPEHHRNNRYTSFAPQTTGNAKWYVDGCSYFWAVSEAIEAAQKSIYILDWWLSPELYLRRPPSANERYRLDKLLHAAAERGVKVHIIVYKEVQAALTCLSLGSGNIAKSSIDALKAIYGTSDGMVLFWAHHEKLCLIDERLVFMGGLDMCEYEGY
ncbi:hypothetical protein jhhlp_003728 [Lomentospora prolificans]|uniref:phospholipase D n=1 Tax=Lomentospora prolificans TaxID=41688 RepID=A0A2N3N9N1_9PEZI|nr:hypothetical protein jhhlp_003728 [Lomentospora prolificans]